ncbi:MAG: hypothetical protein J6I62_01360 [Selenomonadaceae bacterium]|nr:hypothetical protein [Selenomonadaceae bacterium]
MQEAWQNPKVQEVVQDKRVQAFWQNKTARYIVLAVVAVLFLYVGRGFYITSHYESKCKDVITILSDANKLSDKFNAASGDPKDGDTKDAIDELEDTAKEIASLNESLKSLTPPEGKQGERTQITSYLDKYEIMFREAHKVMSVKGLIIEKVNPDEYKIAVNSVTEYIKTYQDAYKMPPIFIKGENVKSVLDMEKFTNAWKDCFTRREEKDKAFYKERKKEYEARLKEANESIKSKNEVGFLVSDVVKRDDDIVIKGNFYNGTDKGVRGIEEVTVDLTLKCLDDTVYTINDYKISSDTLKKIHIYPKDKTSYFSDPDLFIKDEAKNIQKPFDNFEVTVKDIKYGLDLSLTTNAGGMPNF